MANAKKKLDNTLKHACILQRIKKQIENVFLRFGSVVGSAVDFMNMTVIKITSEINHE